MPSSESEFTLFFNLPFFSNFLPEIVGKCPRKMPKVAQTFGKPGERSKLNATLGKKYDVLPKIGQESFEKLQFEKMEIAFCTWVPNWYVLND